MNRHLRLRRPAVLLSPLRFSPFVLSIACFETKPADQYGLRYERYAQRAIHLNDAQVEAGVGR